MATSIRDDLRREVIVYLKMQAAPVTMRNMAEDLRKRKDRFKGLRDADIRDVVQPMIATGKLAYAPGLKVKLATGQ
ncbi:MAG: hypothetical protein SFV51_21650 [Bryobacteraceae bacterium]|nr:hypothetical protein [Bryobacteraceae bacterium]